MTNLAQHFTSSRAFADWIDKRIAENGGNVRTFGSDLSTMRKGVDTLRDGNERHVPDAEKLLSNFNETIEVPSHVWGHDLAGAFPDVPAMLSLEPESMWTIQPVMSDRTPLRVWIGLTSSGGIGESDLIKRGCVLAAFALAVSSKRPVLLSPYVNLGSHSYGSYGTDTGREGALISWDISTQPFIMSELLGCTSEPSVTRYAGITACYLLNPGVTGAWHPDFDNEAKMREHLHAAPDDLYLPSIHLYDELLSDPIKWLKTNVAKYTEGL